MDFMTSELRPRPFPAVFDPFWAHRAGTLRPSEVQEAGLGMPGGDWLGYGCADEGRSCLIDGGFAFSEDIASLLSEEQSPTEWGDGAGDGRGTDKSEGP